MRRATGALPSHVWWAVAVVLLVAVVGALAWAFWPHAAGPSAVQPVTATAAFPLTTAPPPAAPPITEPPTKAPAPAALTTTTTEPPPVAALDFDVARAMSHIQVLADDIGVRVSGSENETLASDYAARYLESLGYTVVASEVLLPDGGISHNVRASKTGESPWVILIGGHIDSKAPSPGANDNASGAAVILELARDLREADVFPTIEFVLFGAEEMVDSNADHHHYGSRQYVQNMTAEERSALAAMVSVDMVAYGNEFLVRDMDRGPSTLIDLLLVFSKERALGLAYAKDTGAYGWSDHEPFELSGYPSAWLEWGKDPMYHTARDDYGHCDPDPVGLTGELLLGFLTRLTESELALLADARALDEIR